MERKPAPVRRFEHQLHKVFLLYTAAFLLFVLCLALLEQMGLPRHWIGMSFLLGNIAIYAAIGIISNHCTGMTAYVTDDDIGAIMAAIRQSVFELCFDLVRETKS